MSVFRLVECPDSLDMGQVEALFGSVGWFRERRDWKRLENSLLYGSDYLAVAYDEEGVLAGLVCAVDDGLHAVVTSLLVRSDCQGFQVGSDLLDLLKDFYDGYRVILSTSKARGFYERHGFKRVGDGMELDLTGENV